MRTGGSLKIRGLGGARKFKDWEGYRFFGAGCQYPITCHDYKRVLVFYIYLLYSSAINLGSFLSMCCFIVEWWKRHEMRDNPYWINLYSNLVENWRNKKTALKNYLELRKTMLYWLIHLFYWRHVSRHYPICIIKPLYVKTFFCYKHFFF